ncbi:hypothetical protein R1flu_022116 [Riccia fluitans]|uniref:Uncharacterized protein n=1 Tax=Riccia fluitans TaxID=41844 RepID=A0ABD1ZRH3_9MARC
MRLHTNEGGASKRTSGQNDKMMRTSSSHGDRWAKLKWGERGVARSKPQVHGLPTWRDGPLNKLPRKLKLTKSRQGEANARHRTKMSTAAPMVGSETPSV